MDKLSSNKLSITSWAEADRPREKLMQHGRRHLSDAELLAILIGTGNREETAVDLSKRILTQSNNQLNHLATLSVKELAKFKGIGEAKAITIVAALELGRRRKEEEKPVRQKITSPEDAFKLIQADLQDLQHEEFWLILLNRSNFFLTKLNLSIGGQTGTVVDPKMVFKSALDHQAVALILVHNHPSGNLQPSKQDRELTTRLVQLGKMMEIDVLDHLIVHNDTFHSMANDGLI